MQTPNTSTVPPPPPYHPNAPPLMSHAPVSPDVHSSMPPPPPVPPQFSQPMEGVADPHHNDVLCGRGVTTNRHKGNENFRGFVNRNKALYVSSTKRQKMTISRSIVEAVRNLDPPGRFLEKDLNTSLWFDVGDKKAVEKTSQALRDGAANLRKQLSEDLTDPTFIGAVFGDGDKKKSDGKDGKNGGKQAAKKKAKNSHSRSFSDSLCTPNLNHEANCNKNDKDTRMESHPCIPGHQMSFPPNGAPGSMPPPPNGYDSSTMHVDHPDYRHSHTHGAMHSSYTINDRNGGYPGYPEYPPQGHPHHMAPYPGQHGYHPNPNQHQHVVSPNSSVAGANSPPYSPPQSPPYSPPANSTPVPPQHNYPHNQHHNQHHTPYTPNPYSSASPPYHTPQSQPYWTPHSAASPPYHTVTPEGRPYYPHPYHHQAPPAAGHPPHSHPPTAPWRPQEAPQDYVEVTHEGQYQFPDKSHHDARRPPPPVSPSSADGRDQYYDAHARSRRHHSSKNNDKHYYDGHEMRDRTPSPNRRHYDNNLFDDASMCSADGERMNSSSSDACPPPSGPHTDFTPPRSKQHRRRANSLEDSPISLGSGKLDDIWLKEAPLILEQRIAAEKSAAADNNSSNSSIKSGDSFMAPLPYRDHTSSNISPLMNIFCGCAPAYCPNDINLKRPNKSKGN